MCVLGFVCDSLQFRGSKDSAVSRTTSLGWGDVVQLIDDCLVYTKSWVQSPAMHKARCGDS